MGEGIRKEGWDRKKQRSQDILPIGRLDIPVVVGNKSGMKKFFSLEASNHKPARLADKIKSEVRKYLKRERSKELPEGVDFWDFDCRQGESAENAQSLHEKRDWEGDRSGLGSGMEGYLPRGSGETGGSDEAGALE